VLMRLRHTALNPLFNGAIQNVSCTWLHGVVDERRTFNTPLREPLNPIIHHMLKAVDWHVSAYLRTGDRWHMEQAQAVRGYIQQLKDWVVRQEQSGC
jgi:hypothetical protein